MTCPRAACTNPITCAHLGHCCEANNRECSSCEGTGKLWNALPGVSTCNTTRPCAACNGTGRVQLLRQEQPQ